MARSVPRARRILYTRDLSPGGTCLHRFDSLRRLGQDVHPFNVETYRSKSRTLEWLRYRYPTGPLIWPINRDLVKKVAELRPDVVWFDKPISFTAETMHAIKKLGAQIAFYVMDSPFGPRKDSCWHQFMDVYRMAAPSFARSEYSSLLQLGPPVDQDHVLLRSADSFSAAIRLR